MSKPADLEALRDTARETGARLGDRFEAATRDGPAGSEAVVALNREALRTLAADGLMDLPFLAGDAPGPADIGRASAIVEGLSWSSGTAASIFMVNVIFGAVAVTLIGTGRQREMLAGLRDGSTQLAFAMTEPEAGSDAGSLRTTARRDGDGWRLDGEKTYTTGAASATHILVVARQGESDERRAMSLFLVPSAVAGLAVAPMAKLAGNAQPSCHVRLDGVRLGDDDILGGPEAAGKAWPKLQITGALERLMVAASAVGSADRIVTEATQFAAEREQFGQPIAAFQSIQHLLVDMRTRAHTMRLLRDDALAATASGDPTVGVCTAKYYCAETLQELVGAGMRVFGGRAYLKGHPMERIYREAPLALYAGGTVELQKNLIARALGI